MKKIVSSLLVFALPVALLASEEGAKEGHGWTAPIWGVPAIIWQFVNLALVIALFYYLLRVRLPNAFRQRSVEIDAALKKAKEEKRESLQKLKELEEKMARLEDEVKKIESEARESAEREKSRLTASAAENAERLRKEADEEFRRREMEAERRLKSVVVGEALKLARETIQKSVNEEDEEKLFGRFSKELKDRIGG